MSPIIASVLARLAATAFVGTAASVPSITSGEPSAIPASPDEAIIQAVLAVAGIAIFYARKHFEKPRSQGPK